MATFDVMDLWWRTLLPRYARLSIDGHTDHASIYVRARLQRRHAPHGL